MEEKKVNFYTNSIYFVVLVLLVVFRICGHYGVFSFLGDGGSYILNAFVQVGIIFLLPLLLFKVVTKGKTKEIFKFCCFKKISAKTILLCVILGVVVFFLNVFVSNFFNNLIALFGYKHTSSSSSTISATWGGFFLNLLCTAVLPAICEETLHRGLLLNGNSMRGIKKSVLISGFLFGLLHLNIEQFFYATIIGLFLGYLCWGCSSVYPCIIVHFMNNAMSVFFSFAKAKGWAIGSLIEKFAYFLTQNQVLGTIIFVLVVLILVIVAIDLTMMLIKETFNYNFNKRKNELTSMAIRDNFFKQVEDIKNNQYPGDTGFSRNQVVFDLRDFLEFVNKNINSYMQEDDDKKVEKTKFDNLSKIFLFGSIVLGAIVTIMTFIWGIL